MTVKMYDTHPCRFLSTTRCKFFSDSLKAEIVRIEDAMKRSELQAAKEIEAMNWILSNTYREDEIEAIKDALDVPSSPTMARGGTKIVADGSDSFVGDIVMEVDTRDDGQ